MTMTTFLGEFAAVLGDVALRSIVVLALVAAPVLVVQAITTGVSFTLEILARF